MAVVTISHQLGSGGEEIAKILASLLGYRLVGAEVLAKAAHEHGLVEDRLTRLGESKPPLLDRLSAEAQVYVAVMQKAVLDAALEDDVVLVGRGGQWLLRGLAHVVRVRVLAPFNERAQRLTEGVAQHIRGHDGHRLAHDAVETLLRRDDSDRRGRMQYLYDRDLDDPLLYDVVFNNARDQGDGAVQAVAVLVRSAEAYRPAETIEQLADRVLAATVNVALSQDQSTRGYSHLDVQASAGVVHVTTRAATPAVEAVARSVRGVRDVRVTEIPVVPLPL